MLRYVAPAATRRLRHLSGSSGNYTVIKHCSHLFERCPSSTAIRSFMGTMVSNFSIHYNSNHVGEYSTRAMPQHHTAEVSLNSTSGAEHAEQPIKDLPESLKGKTKKGAKKKTSYTEGYQLDPTELPVVFECGTCTAVCVKRIFKGAFEGGSVIVRCLDCWNINLIADHLGLFKEPGSVEKFLSNRGVDVTNGPDPVYEITPENLAEVMKAATSSAPENLAEVMKAATSSAPENSSEVMQASTSSTPENSSEGIQSSTGSTAENPPEVVQSTTSL